MKAKKNKGAALVVTLIVLTALAVVAVAMITNTSLDRTAVASSANIYRAQLAAESGLQTAISILQSSYGPNMTLSLNRTAANPASWTIQYNTVSLNGTILSSNSSLPTIAPIDGPPHTFTLPTGNRTAPKYPITNGNQTIGAFSYLVIDNTAKQCLDRFPTIPRSYSTSLREVPFITSNLTLATGLSGNTSNLPSVASANLLFGQNLGINARWADIQNHSPTLAPDGKPKLNLRRLKYFVDNLSVSQELDNPRAQVVEALLEQTSSINAVESWGGGGLTWLTSSENPRRYTLVEARQIAANLLDYIDADLHPTTDNADNPTYFGTEGRLNADGQIQGHPFVTAVGFGLVFNRSGNPTGALNSTRVLGYWSLVNPWSAPLQSFHSFYKVIITVSINGTATGGTLGNNASDYFLENLDEELQSGPTDLAPNSGSTFPQAPGTAAFFTRSYANFNSFFQANNQQPVGMSFQNLEFKIDRMHLEYTDSNGLSSVVQTLNNLETTPIPFHINNYAVPVTQGASPVQRPGEVKNGLFLNGDPRLNYDPTQWIEAQLTQESAISNSPPESNPAANVFTSMNSTAGDGQQGLPSNHTWYSSPETAKHFFVRSPPAITSNPATTPFNPMENPNGQVAVESAAELGYLSTGRPWQTLRMVVDPANLSTGGDYSILDFIDSGTFSTTNQTLTLNGATSNQTVVNGKVNPNTLLAPTAKGLFEGIPGLNQAQATSLVEMLTENNSPAGYPFTRVGSLGALPEMATLGATTKFAREDLMRRIANLLTTQSTDFTILSHGEARNPMNDKIVSTASMESRVRINLTPTGTPVVTITSRKIE
jgi:hypothetical protein